MLVHSEYFLPLKQKLTVTKSTIIMYEVLCSNKGVHFNKKYLVSQSCLGNDDGGGDGGSRQRVAMRIEFTVLGNN